MSELTAAEAGWYDDPLSDEQLRLWDGTGWTDHVRPWPAPTGLSGPGVGASAAPRPPREGPPSALPQHGVARRRAAAVVATAVVATALVAGLVVLLGAWVLSHHAERPRLVGSTKVSAASTRRPTAPDCALARARPAASQVVASFKSRGLPVRPAKPPTLPGDACSVASFRDARDGASNVVTAYPTIDAATAAAQTAGAGALAEYIYVLRLAPGLAPRAGEYRASFNALISTFPPYTPSTTRRP